MDNQARLAEATKVVNAKIGFMIHSTVFVLVNTLLIAINLTTSTEYLWFWWPLAGWGAGLLCHAGLILCWSQGRSLKRSMIEREMQAGNRDG